MTDDELKAITARTLCSCCIRCERHCLCYSDCFYAGERQMPVDDPIRQRCGDCNATKLDGKESV